MSFETVKLGALEYLISENLAAPHCFTTRLGGVSTGQFSSLNLAVRSGEQEENVAKNFRILGQAVGFDPEKLVLTHQIHSDLVRTVDRSDCRGCFHKAYPECDGLVTNTPGITLAVFTADCTPILLHDPVTGAVGAVHAGWRGTASAIAARAVEAMAEHFGAKPENICAAIGPNVGVCHFETDADVPNAMLDAFGKDAQAFIFPRGNKYYVNLKELNALVLRRAGVRSISVSEECTMCSPDRFWSHRITGGRRGAQGAIIVRKENTL